MSTRATIAAGDGYHLYRELMDDSIHLELHNSDVLLKAEGGYHFVDAVLSQTAIRAIREADIEASALGGFPPEPPSAAQEPRAE